MNKLFLISVMVFATLSAHAQTRYPAAPKDNTVDEYFGVKVADPFRPLENDTAELTAQWVEAENKVTNALPAEDSFPRKTAEEAERSG